MTPLKFKRIEIRRPRYDPHPEKSKTNNSRWRVGLFVIFEDYKGLQYDYMPKWDELKAIMAGKDNVESENQRLARIKANEVKP